MARPYTFRQPLTDAEYLRQRWSEFWMNVSVPEDPTACWEWNGYVGSNRRGQFWFHRDMAASRAAWIMFHGPIQRKDYICHKCDNPKCVRLEHLYKGTHATNQRDEATRGRRKNDKGHNARLTWDQVNEIRAFKIPAPTGRKEIRGHLPPYLYSSEQIAKRFGVSSTTVLRIWRGDVRGGWREEVPNG